MAQTRKKERIAKGIFGRNMDPACEVMSVDFPLCADSSACALRKSKEKQGDFLLPIDFLKFSVIME